MNYKRKLSLIIVLVSILFLVGCSQLSFKKGTGSEQTKEEINNIPIKPQVGFRAPDFTLTDLNGKQVSLSDFRGKQVVFINFWASWCPPCRAEMPYIEEVHQEGKDKVKVLAVNLKESKSKVQNFVEKNDYNFTVLLDKTGEIANNYLVRGIPKTVIVDKNGIIKAQHVGAMNKDQMNKLINKAF
ncbi:MULTISPECIES: TlpA family protein disulfide reductase [unclassified Candidatus Frackibacter]|uniref:TlpA family protein disulfide reductase n=1 Tax=unclassified Candidatus Frackibacter TaxID=2648818 RepID=UPI0007987658|nr:MULTISPECIES: TlpA disulfide reductase family protein [unclassified Candidatus Frackibacter]KXS43539.1 MAG: alkyl hydroperoxide reductase [Candidatus Frackibacter sp. T328-2]SEM66041.1 thiol:disulfide oxidoreductases, DsbE subfamily protein [Candidatus Frackibacter sp. WG12]SFL77361.1 thiol:disulfide oxidoreductases, DsbE subfamily protein [Candidatus Frackibacter sp. WG13]